ncbi:MAG: MarR family transcriptional regulator [Pseudomonadota bacterium]
MGTSKKRQAARVYDDLLDTIEFPEAYRLTYLAGAVAVPAYGDIKRDLGLIRAEYVLLACLSHFDEMTAQDVARISRRPRNTVSRAVHRMIDDGLIERAPDASDGRQAQLKITPAGLEMHLKAAAYLKARQEVVLDGLTADERAQFSALLRKTALFAAQLDD